MKIQAQKVLTFSTIENTGIYTSRKSYETRLKDKFDNTNSSCYISHPNVIWNYFCFLNKVGSHNNVKYFELHLEKFLFIYNPRFKIMPALTSVNNIDC